MFGFVRPCEDKLSKQEKEIFRSYYCGVCKSIARRYTHMARFTLTYDCAFLAMFLTAVKESRPETQNTMCVCRKRNVVVSDIVDYCADVNLMLAYYKLDDDVNDDNSLKAKMARAAFKRAFNKAKKKNQKAEGKFVTFKQGDSLIGLCAKEYKNSGYAPMIASINNLISFRDIKPGTQLWFPKI